jgi:hypothetical protein
VTAITSTLALSKFKYETDYKVELERVSQRDRGRRCVWRCSCLTKLVPYPFRLRSSFVNGGRKERRIVSRRALDG